MIDSKLLIKEDTFGPECPMNWEEIANALNEIIEQRIADAGVDASPARQIGMTDDAEEIAQSVWEEYCDGNLPDVPEAVDDDPHWYLIDECGDIFDTPMRAKSPASAARELIQEWDRLSDGEKEKRTAFYAAYGTKGTQGDILYGDDGYTIEVNKTPRSVSLDNGNIYDSDVDYLMQEGGPIEEGNLWDALVENMDDDTRELVSDMDPVSEKQFLEWYLLLAPADLIVG